MLRHLRLLGIPDQAEGEPARLQGRGCGEESLSPPLLPRAGRRLQGLADPARHFILLR